MTNNTDKDIIIMIMIIRIKWMKACIFQENGRQEVPILSSVYRCERSLF